MRFVFDRYAYPAPKKQLPVEDRLPLQRVPSGSEERYRGGLRSVLSRFLLRMVLWATVALLPFYLLIRVALHTYHAYAFSGWGALAAGAAATVVLLWLYGLWAGYRVTGRLHLSRGIRRLFLLLVVSYCGYGLLYLSHAQVKEPSLRAQYRSLHPLLRVAVTTVTLADSDLLITDMQRSPGDYRRMGLTPLQESMHYLQPSGYVHAVDLRTLGRAEWKNLLTRILFETLGFETLRHTGTADHLHVALPLND